jgi:hypothetical protein
MIVPKLEIVKNLSGDHWSVFKVKWFTTLYGFCLDKHIVYVCLLREWPKRPAPVAAVD